MIRVFFFLRKLIAHKILLFSSTSQKRDFIWEERDRKNMFCTRPSVSLWRNIAITHEKNEFYEFIWPLKMYYTLSNTRMNISINKIRITVSDNKRLPRHLTLLASSSNRSHWFPVNLSFTFIIHAKNVETLDRKQPLFYKSTWHITYVEKPYKFNVFFV